MIKVKHCKGLFMVWNADDVIRLRTEHRIVGNLVGALPEYPRQHQDSGLPLVLMPEEVRLLSQKSLISIVDTSEESYYSSDQCQQYYQQLQSEQYTEINNRFKATRKAEFEANLDRIVQGKLRKAKLDFSNSPEELSAFREKVLSELVSSIQDVPPDSNSLLTRFYVESPYPNAPERGYQLEDLAPLSLEAIKFAVFEDFWLKGYYLTDGLKFGAHFLAYDHDPIAFHAKFIIVCSTEPQLDDFQRNLLQAYGRLGKNVRKNVIVAHFTNTESTPKIAYKHIQWNSIGLA